MIAAFLLLAVSPFTVTNAVYNGPMQRPPNARLVWHDEFGGTTLDRSKWDYDTSRNKQGWFNGELEYYSAGQNLKITDGVLTIEARHEKLDPQRYPDWGGQDYTSSKIVSKGTGLAYGYYEIRAKLPCARGTWPAIWMLPTNMQKWPDDGEIDIMEQVGSEPNLIYASLHTKLFTHVLKT